MWETLEDRRMMSVSTGTITQQPLAPTSTITANESLRGVAQELSMLMTSVRSAEQSLQDAAQQAAKSA
jgi:hypothetical protein